MDEPIGTNRPCCHKQSWATFAHRGGWRSASLMGIPGAIADVAALAAQAARMAWRGTRRIRLHLAPSGLLEPR